MSDLDSVLVSSLLSPKILSLQLRGMFRTMFIIYDDWFIKTYLSSIKTDFCLLVAVAKVSQINYFSFFPNLIYLQGHILNKKIISNNDKLKLVNWHKNRWFGVFFLRAHYYIYIKSRIALLKLLLTFLYFKGLHWQKCLKFRLLGVI